MVVSRRHDADAAAPSPGWQPAAGLGLLGSRRPAIAASAKPSSSSSEARESGGLLGGRLDLDQAALAGDDDVGVDLGTGVLGVVEIAEQLAADDAARDRRDRPGERVALEIARLEQAVEGEPEGDVSAGDRGAAGAAVGLKDVAVDVDRAVAAAPRDRRRREATARSAAGSRVERPSGRPRAESRCLRSPVDAGSIAYSAVTQPRPLPSSHFGTELETEAVQMTRVSPCS